MTAEEQRDIGLTFVSRLEFCELSGVDSMFQFPSSKSTFNTVHDSLDDVWDNIICPCIGTEDNANLSDPQKELLTWHWKHGVSMGQVQIMMRENKAVDDNRCKTILPPIIPPKFTSTPTCPSPKSFM